MAEKAAGEKATPDKAALEKAAEKATPDKAAAKKSAAKKAAAKKAAAKKEQQKNKNTKQNKKKKNKENGVNHWIDYHVPYINISHKKKEGNKISYQKKNFHYSSKKKSGSPFKVVFKFLFTGMIYLLFILGFLYIVDFEKFVHIRNGTALVLNKTVSLLPAEVISKGNGVIQYIHPTMEVIVGKIRVALNETSTLLNTNPLLKDHWTNIREISSICSERLIDYIRTLYLHITGYFHCAKHKLFQ